MSKWLIAPGDDRIGVTDAFVLFVADEASTIIADQACAGTTTLDALDVLLAGGISSAPDFCLVTVQDGHGTAFLRGEVSLRLEAQWGDAVIEHGDETRSLREVSVQGVSRFAILGASTRHRVDTAVRRLQETTVPVPRGTHAASMLIWEQTDVPHTELITEPQLNAAFPEDLFETAQLNLGPFAKPAYDADFDEPDIEAAPRLSEAGEGETSEGSHLYDELFGVTMHTNIEGAAVRFITDDDEPESPQPPPASAPPPAPATPEHATPGHATTAWQLELPGGALSPVGHAAVIGRRPAAYPLADSANMSLIELTDPLGNLSRSHVYLFVSQGRLFVQDLQSTNGTVIVHAGTTTELAPDVPVEAFVGDELVLGGDVRVVLKGHP